MASPPGYMPVFYGGGLARISLIGLRSSTHVELTLNENRRLAALHVCSIRTLANTPPPDELFFSFNPVVRSDMDMSFLKTGHTLVIHPYAKCNLKTG